MRFDAAMLDLSLGGRSSRHPGREGGIPAGWMAGRFAAAGRLLTYSSRYILSHVGDQRIKFHGQILIPQLNSNSESTLPSIRVLACIQSPIFASLVELLFSAT